MSDYGLLRDSLGAGVRGLELQDVQATALNTQVGGGHYKDLAIQPVEYCMKNNLNYCQANIVKYATRYKDKNGLEDLKKIKHYVDLIIELEYGRENE